MSQDENAVSKILDDMAVKILMVEPGDLSVVGDLLAAAEDLLATEGEAANLPVLHAMAHAFKSALERMIMGELSDSAENYELLGKAITQIQEAVRKGSDMDEAGVAAFAQHLSEAGYPVTAADLLGGDKSLAEEPAQEATPMESLPAQDKEPGAAAEAPAEVSPEAPPAPALEQAPAVGGGVPDFLQDKELLGGFIEEAFEHLESIEVNVLELEQNPGDLDIVNNIFRPFHTIKGVSGFLNLRTINKLAHATENLLDDVRNGKREMDSDVIDLVLTVGDTLRSMVENIKEVLENGPEYYQDLDITSQLEHIQTLQEGKSPAASAPEAPVAATGTAAAGAATGAPAAAAVPAGGEAQSSSAGAAEPATAPEAAMPAPAGAGRPQGGESPAPAAANGQATPRKKMGASIKVDVEKLDALVNAVGELVIMQSLVRQNPLVAKIADPKLIKDFSQLSRITSDLQHTAMSMRMVPIKQTFDKMIRLVRDLSKKSGKEVNLVMEGADTEIDRNMVDSIYDPLVHMMRNSVDHGIQPPDERVKHGKTPTGKVSLRAYQKGGNMVIEIEDDGEGLNTVKIRKKAESRGLVQPGDNLSDHELNNMIFMPGFSTADQITDVSGRGVGMDVVKKAVEKLRGKVEVQSQPGKGSLFTIRLPLTLAIIDGIIVRVGSERYIIPTTAIQESMKPERKNYNTVHGRGESLLVRGELLPVIRLYKLFGVENPTHTDPCEAIVVVVENEGRRRALMVDELLGKEEVVIKNLGGMSDVRGVAGGTILGDGRVGLILDLAGVIASAAE
ncbi:chemotaxis protein CheA [Desulfurivibrio alkaliphilus]|uniref:Chemotaxis protein CheA n=1 Tax=Desulfurivibrio alkaliphilus (strain DSM 19089 / UNIQEM U267 / AHT2) TaxID=589865 RepID=D6Z4A4_DESAT|nr:chemotaxis protein CheA [Desulfurivibrio alkaliphilus]ADH86379.1 CheA signal transduction histidine kinase [Desulfurivibrio alkaliphilus AHT 2]